MLLQTQSHSLRPLTTAHLAQTMTLLELTSAELRQKIEGELAANPALEIVDPPRCPICQRFLSSGRRCPVCSAGDHPPSSEPVIFVSPRSDFYSSRNSTTEDGLPGEEFTAAVEDLPTFVLRQIAPELDPSDRMLAAHLLTSLDEDGLLSAPLIEIARYHHVPLSRVEKVLRLIQHAEPLGVGSPNPQAALLVQLEGLAENRQVPQLAAQAIQEGIDLLSRRAYAELGKLLGVSMQQAQSIASFIAENLNPFPARAHWGDIHQSPAPAVIVQQPDILVNRLNDRRDAPLVVEIISPYAGSLRINPLFRQALSDAPSEKSEQWQADLEGASLLIKCLQQRDNTLVRLMQRLVRLQRRFFLEGDAFLIPVTRAHLAEELSVHESTISRAVSGKAVQLPNHHIIPLARLFDRSLSIRTALLQIISEERRPLSDTEIVDLLMQQGFMVARRTVAKYRAMEGILPARLRQAETHVNRRYCPA